MNTNCDITILNQYTENRVTKFKKSYVLGVQWEDSKGVNVIQSGLTGVDNSTLYIPFSSMPDYVKPVEFKSNQQGVTLQVGDIVIKGKIAEELSETVTLKTLESMYDDVRLITTVDTLDYGSEDMQHWEVGAK